MRSAVSVFNGKPHEDILKLHTRYGDVVRVGPNELSFTHEKAWKEICGHLKHGQPECEKDRRFAEKIDDTSLIHAPRDKHGPLRRALAHAFSAKALGEQMPLINQYIDLLMRRLHENGEHGTKPLNMVHWFDWTTFDIVGDLAFGEPFGCLQESKAHPWVNLFVDAMKSIPMLQSLQDLPFSKVLGPLYLILYTPAVKTFSKFKTSMEFSYQTVHKRINLGMNRPDFMHHMMQKRDDYVSTIFLRSRVSKLTTCPQQMTEVDMVNTSSLLVTAGSETTSTVLAGTMYLLGSHPEVLVQLKAEIRSSFQSEEEITMNSARNLTYLMAVIKESMRIFPAVPIALRRVAPAKGVHVAGHYIPGGVRPLTPIAKPRLTYMRRLY
jgi:cytochrome P450